MRIRIRSTTSIGSLPYVLRTVSCSIAPGLLGRCNSHAWPGNPEVVDGAAFTLGCGIIRAMSPALRRGLWIAVAVLVLLLVAQLVLALSGSSGPVRVG